MSDLSVALQSINYTKENVSRFDKDFKLPPAFVINRCLSYFSDCIFYTNEANQMAGTIGGLGVYEFLLHGVRRRKRFSKWLKPNASDVSKAIVFLHACSITKAKEYEKLLSDQEKKKILELADTGGLDSNAL